MQTKKEKRKNAQVSITGLLPKDRILSEKTKTLQRIQREIELPGFRKGKVPIEKVREYIGEKSLWHESAEAVLKNDVETILKEHEILPIMPVGASLKPSDIDVDVPFEIIAIVAPTCNVGDYKSIASAALSAVEPLDAEKETREATDAFRKQTRTMTQSTGDGPLTDDEARKLGFENGKAAEFFIAHEAEHAIQNKDIQRKRGSIAEALIAKGSCDIPEILIREEAVQLLEATKKDFASRGVPFNEYVKQTGKTEEALRDELLVPSEKRVALDIIFGEIARKENLQPDENEEERLSRALQNQGIDQETARRYVRATILREKVWDVLGAKAPVHEHDQHPDNSEHAHQTEEIKSA